MNILYGVQGTGNGHISRSREMVKALCALGHQVQVLVSGRPRELLPALPEFGSYLTRKGLTFVTNCGKLRPMRTALKLDLRKFFSDIRAFDPSPYDLVITDFEPLTARIARRTKLPCVGIGHQYAFFHDIPMVGDNTATRWIIKHFAFCDQPIGLHWHHFDHPILPPIVPPLDHKSTTVNEALILVYLPFESIDAIRNLLQPFNSNSFHIYGKTPHAVDEGPLHFRPFSREGFLTDLYRCNGVICNAGFELPSEALQLGKKLLLRPLNGQMEQESNALAFEKLRLGSVMQKLDSRAVEGWLTIPSVKLQHYPNVAEFVAEWIHSGRTENPKDLSHRVWQQVGESQNNCIYSFQ